jgi:multicomponent Na+:H+ antiporter subunit E
VSEERVENTRDDTDGTDGTDGRRGRWRHRWRDPVGWRRQLPLLVWATALWMLLWDDLSWGNLVNGAVLAVVLTRVFYLPPAELSGRVNLYWVAVFLLGFLVDLVKSSWHVTRLALWFGHTPRNAVIAVSLHTSSDLLLTLVGNALTLIPGSSVLDVDRLNYTLYVHVLDAPDDEAVERNRGHILLMERRLIRALGSREEIASLASDGTAPASRDGGGAR